MSSANSTVEAPTDAAHAPSISMELICLVATAVWAAALLFAAHKLFPALRLRVGDALSWLPDLSTLRAFNAASGIATAMSGPSDEHAHRQHPHGLDSSSRIPATDRDLRYRAHAYPARGLRAAVRAARLADLRAARFSADATEAGSVSARVMPAPFAAALLTVGCAAVTGIWLSVVLWAAGVPEWPSIVGAFFACELLLIACMWRYFLDRYGGRTGDQAIDAVVLQFHTAQPDTLEVLPVNYDCCLTDKTCHIFPSRVL
jgi:hypothetical protein